MLHKGLGHKAETDRERERRGDRANALPGPKHDTDAWLGTLISICKTIEFLFQTSWYLFLQSPRGSSQLLGEMGHVRGRGPAPTVPVLCSSQTLGISRDLGRGLILGRSSVKPPVCLVQSVPISHWGCSHSPAAGPGPWPVAEAGSLTHIFVALWGLHGAGGHCLLQPRSKTEG